MAIEASAKRERSASSPKSRARVAAQAAKAQVVLSKRLGLEVDPRIEALARKAHY